MKHEANKSARELSELIDELYSITEPHSQVESALYLEINDKLNELCERMRLI